MKQRAQHRIHLIRRLFVGFGVLTCVALLPGTTLMQRQPSSSPMQLVPAFQEAQVRPVKPMQVARYKGEYFVVDYKTSRILVYDRQINYKRSIGVVGAGPGEMFHPNDLVISPSGFIYVNDSGNDRIQVLTLEGKFVSQFTPYYFRGFGVTSKEEVLLGQPERGKLVSVYSRDGKLLRAFGDLRKFSDVYGEQYKDKDAKYKEAINRISLFVDQSDNVYVTFLLAPILQKYDRHGRRLCESQLTGKSIDLLTQMLLTETPNKIMSVGMDGIEARLVSWCVTVDGDTGDIFVVLPDNTIYVLNKDCQRVAELVPAWPNLRGSYSYHISTRGPSSPFINKLLDGEGWYFFRMAVLGRKETFLISLIPPGVFRMELPGKYE